jgi:hypothetical protein
MRVLTLFFIFSGTQTDPTIHSEKKPKRKLFVQPSLSPFKKYKRGKLDLSSVYNSDPTPDADNKEYLPSSSDEDM